MRSIGSEILSTVAVLSIPLGIVLAFPFGAVGFRATEEVRHSVRAALVEMSPEVEHRILHAVHAAWRGKSGGTRHLRTDLFCAELPKDEHLSVLSLRDRSRVPDLPAVRCERTPFLPSQKAPPPSPIAADAMPEPLAFPREELLRIN